MTSYIVTNKILEDQQTYTCLNGIWIYNNLDQLLSMLSPINKIYECKILRFYEGLSNIAKQVKIVREVKTIEILASVQSKLQNQKKI